MVTDEVLSYVRKLIISRCKMHVRSRRSSREFSGDLLTLRSALQRAHTRRKVIAVETWGRVLFPIGLYDEFPELGLFNEVCLPALLALVGSMTRESVKHRRLFFGELYGAYRKAKASLDSRIARDKLRKRKAKARSESARRRKLTRKKRKAQAKKTVRQRQLEYEKNQLSSLDETMW
jgi:hypothetical protein